MRASPLRGPRDAPRTAKSSKVGAGQRLSPNTSKSSADQVSVSTGDTQSQAPAWAARWAMAKRSFALDQRLLRPLALGDVQERAHRAARPALLVEERRGVA